MTLPFDIARCEGRITRTPIGHISTVRVTSDATHPECRKCRRREPGHASHQPYMNPPPLTGGKCQQRIAP